MHDPKFEKEVQQKMEELSFHPSETVWKNVERGIRTDRKRRPAVLWLFLLAGILLAGGYFMSLKTTDGNSLAAENRGMEKENKEMENREKEEKKNTGRQNTVTENGDTENKTAEDKSAREKIAESRSAEAESRSAENAVAKNKTLDKKTADKEAIGNTAAGNEKNVPGLTGQAAAGNRRPHRTGPAGNKKTSAVDKEISGGERSAEEQRTGKEPKTAAAWRPAVLPPLMDIDGLSRKEITARPPKGGAAARSVPEKAVARVESLKPVHRWKLGLTGGAGISSVQNSFLHAATVAQEADVASRFAAYPSALQKHPSTIGNGFSYKAGFFVQRTFRRRLSFSLGMTYHYYSTEVKTGPPNVAQSYNVSNALNYQPQPAAAASTQAFGVGDVGTRHNHYQLLEFPLAMQWEMIPSRKVPVYWEAGLSFSALLDANALYFDGSSGTYYKNNAVFNKSQAILSSAFLFGIPVFGQRLQAGPQIQYGLTDLLKNNSNQGQHLLYGGIKVNFLLGGWK